jgi:uncharacterized membrane protein
MIDVKLVGYLLVTTILFTIYIEYSVGNIIWREGAKGIKEFRPVNIIHYLVNPLHNHFLWRYHLLDVNYIVAVVVATILYYNIPLLNNIDS